MNCQALIDTLQEENQALVCQVEEEMRSLELQQWIWRPEPTTWNVVEALEHLNLTLEKAFQMISPELDQAIADGLNPTETYSVGWVGELAVQLMDNSEERRFNVRMRTSKTLNPLERPLNEQKVLDEFLAHLNTYHTLLERSRLVPLGKVRVKVASGSFIRFRLGDTLRFFSAHTQRHITQIQRLMEHERFPAPNKVQR